MEEKKNGIKVFYFYILYTLSGGTKGVAAGGRGHPRKI
jgi:hypothetical protein